MPLDGFETKLADLFDENISSGRRLFFVQGLWRSGTSWVGRMLGSHPRIYTCQHEIQIYMRNFTVLQHRRPLESNPFLKRRFETVRKSGFLSVLLRLHALEKAEASLIGERSPGADVHLIKQEFPEAKQIIVTRDGRDICVSSAFLATKTGANILAVNPETGIVSFRHMMGQSLTYAAYVPEFFALRDAHPKTTMIVRYEDLLEDTVTPLRQMFDFLEIEITTAEVEAIVQNHTFAKEAGPAAGRESVPFWMRKGGTGDWKSHFPKEGLPIYAAIAGHALQMAGYRLPGEPDIAPFPTTAWTLFDELWQVVDKMQREFKVIDPEHDVAHFKAFKDAGFGLNQHAFGHYFDLRGLRRTLRDEPEPVRRDP